jgi:hypothetical protein
VPHDLAGLALRAVRTWATRAARISDNARAGFVRGGEAPALSQEIWNKYQDQFRVNEGVAPGDIASFDTTTAYVKSGLNIVNPPQDKGVVAGDSILCNSPFVGDGVTTGVRVDLIFRIDPGPGNLLDQGQSRLGARRKDLGASVLGHVQRPTTASSGPAAVRVTGRSGTRTSGIPAGWTRLRSTSTRSRRATSAIRPSPSVFGHDLRARSEVRHPRDQPTTCCFLIDPAGGEQHLEHAVRRHGARGLRCGVGQSKEKHEDHSDGYLTPGSHVEVPSMPHDASRNPGTVVYHVRYDCRVPAGSGRNIDTGRGTVVELRRASLTCGSRPATRPPASLACSHEHGTNARTRVLTVCSVAQPHARLRQETTGATQGWKGLGPGSDFRRSRWLRPRESGPVRPELRPLRHPCVESRSRSPGRSLRLEPRLDRSQGRQVGSVGVDARHALHHRPAPGR